MSVLSQPGGRSFRISNDWIEDNDSAGSTAYVDISSIVQNGQADPYIAWLMANGTSSGDADALICRAKFDPTGIIYYDADGGSVISCVLMEDADVYREPRTLNVSELHRLRVRRIYALNTTARSIEFVGY